MWYIHKLQFCSSSVLKSQDRAQAVVMDTLLSLMDVTVKFNQRVSGILRICQQVIQGLPLTVRNGL